MQEYHLVVLVHGLWGNSSHMEYIANEIESCQKLHASSKEKILVYKTDSHSGFLTYDGIDVNGKRVSNEIENEINRVNQNCGTVTKFSIVGYSLGGLIARYAIGVLLYKQIFKTTQPVNFITFCSPHVGVLTPGNGISITLFNNFVPHLIAHSGSQIFLKDRVPSSNKLPLLVSMCEENSFFFKALKLFRHRALYANIINDKRTSWFTSGISSMDPFNSMYNDECNRYQLDYVPNYEPNVIDVNKPITFTKHEVSREPFNELEEKSGNFIQRKLKWVVVLFNLTVYTPYWVFCFIFVSLLERVKLHRRLDSFFHDTSNNLLALYDMCTDEYVTEVTSEDEIDIDENIETVESMHFEDDKEASGKEKMTTDFNKRQLKNKNPSLTNLGNDLNNQIKDQTDDLLESVWNAMTSKRISNNFYDVSTVKSYEDNENNLAQDSNSTRFDSISATTSGFQSVTGIRIDRRDTVTTTIEELEKFGTSNIIERTSVSESDGMLRSTTSPIEHDMSTMFSPRPSTNSSSLHDNSYISLPLSSSGSVSAADMEATADMSKFWEPFRLSVTKDQDFIIQQLNSLNWSKFPVLIRKTKATHAAAIVRQPDNEDLGEGKVVVRHFVNEVFKIE